jgi:hypothetical protein
MHQFGASLNVQALNKFKQDISAMRHSAVNDHEFMNEFTDMEEMFTNISPTEHGFSLDEKRVPPAVTCHLY